MMERYILEALQKAVLAATVGTDVPPVKYVNRNFKPPTTGKWWEVVYIPNNVENQYWGESKTYQGILRLILHWRQDDTGAYKALDEVSRVAAGFIKGSKHVDPGNNVSVQIVEKPNVLSTLEEPTELLIPLTIRYSFFKI